jgi:hypothetical protein
MLPMSEQESKVSCDRAAFEISHCLELICQETWFYRTVISDFHATYRRQDMREGNLTQKHERKCLGREGFQELPFRHVRDPDFNRLRLSGLGLATPFKPLRLLESP